MPLQHPRNAAPPPVPTSASASKPAGPTGGASSFSGGLSGVSFAFGGGDAAGSGSGSGSALYVAEAPLAGGIRYAAVPAPAPAHAAGRASSAGRAHAGAGLGTGSPHVSFAASMGGVAAVDAPTAAEFSAPFGATIRTGSGTGTGSGTPGSGSGIAVAAPGPRGVEVVSFGRSFAGPAAAVDPSPGKPVRWHQRRRA